MIRSFSVKSDTVDLATSAMNNQSYQADLGDRRVVSPKAGSEMAAALGLQYFESSAKDQTGVEVRSLAGSENKTNERWTKPSKVVQACHPDENQISLFFPLDPSQCAGAVLLPGQRVAQGSWGTGSLYG